jgi:hypothetical protein
MDTVIWAVDCIRRNTLSHRHFQHFLEEVGSKYDDASYYWASEGLLEVKGLGIFFSFAKWNKYFHGEQGQNYTTVLK